MLAFYLVGFFLSGILWFLSEFEDPVTVEKILDILVAMTSSWMYTIRKVILMINPDLMNEELFKIFKKNEKERD